MKMKKTQSLKLMLLGLLALGSTSTFAKVGDVFDDLDSGLMFEELAGNKAKLVGVTSNTPIAYTIPTTVKNGYDRDKQNNPKVLQVTEVADNWFAAGELWYVKNGVKTGETIICPSLLDVAKPFTLTIDAKELKTISTKALQPLNGVIKKFVVNPDAGLTAIPDYAFFRATAIDPIENEAVRDAITALERQKALIDLKIDGKNAQTTKLTDNSVVYYLTELDQTAPKDGVITPVVKSLKPDANGVYDLINAETGEPTGVKAIDWPSSDNLADPESHKVVAAPYWNEIKGLQDQYDDAQTEINTINGAIGTLANNADYITANNAYQTALQRKADADGAIALYALVSALWEQATPAVTTAVGNGNPNQAGLTANEKQLVTDILAAMANAVYTNEAGKQYRYSKTGAGYVRPSVQTMNAEQRDAEADVTTKENAIKNIKTDAGKFRMLNMFELEDALAAAQAAQAAVEPYLNYWKGQRDGIAAQIKDKEDNELLVPQYDAATDLFGNVLNNEVLKTVNLNGTSLVSIGISAFENCVNALFGPSYGGPQSRIPVTTKTIGARAFYNASKINPEFDTLGDLESIGDFAFAKTGATTANFSGATKLASFGTNVFDDCKLKNLLLLGTPLKAVPGNLPEGIYRDYANFVDACGNEWNKNGAKNVLVNQTLTEVSLPAAITEIRDGNFANCLKLATLTGGIPAGVKSIGAEAFFRTKIKEFDLSLLSKLTFIGEKAFAGNAQLTKVILPQNPADGYTLTELPSNVFECDDNLEDVILGPDVICLPAGIFAGNTKMKKLDLSNTQIEVLYDLFQAGDGTEKDAQGNILNPVNNTLEEIILPETVKDQDGNIVIPGLKIIMDHALANLQKLKGSKQADGTYKMIIPSSVFIMRPYVFSNDIALEYVEAMDSRLTNLGVGTFEACSSLKEFKFITLLPINPTWVTVPAGGLVWDQCVTSDDAAIVGFTPVRYWVHPQLGNIYEYEIENGSIVYENGQPKVYGNFYNWQPVGGVEIETEYFPIFGPGIHFDAATFNFDDMQFHGNHAAPVQVWVTEESMNNLQGYYRQTYDNNLVQYSKLNKYTFKLKLDKIKDSNFAL